ncbi:MAG: glycosyltransferase family 4 protein [Telmatospirillum sp.]|nr:glycosyltransferase family 4 protein [Telmatospirillum sp.]
MEETQLVTDRPIRILTFSSLYPNAAQPVNGVFVENRLRHLVASGAVEARVVAPVPWFPSSHPRFGSWARFASAPVFEERHGLKVWHPRYPVIPKVGMTAAPTLMYLWTRSLVRTLAADMDFDLIDAHYFYPDGVAAAMIARDLGKPLVITARGTDINLIPRYALPRAQILRAAARADGLITVCDALKQALAGLGVSPDRIQVLRNGVDLSTFRPGDREEARRELGLSGRVLASVGLLIERKGHHLVIDALARIPDTTLVIAGGGPDRRELENRARSVGVADRVRFLGEIPHHTLPSVYRAADALVLASSREGWANVLLESMACGTPVVASDVWGTREVIGDSEAGILVAGRTADALTEGISRLFSALPDRAATRRYAEQFDWDATTRGQYELFSRIVANRRSPRRVLQPAGA